VEAQPIDPWDYHGGVAAVHGSELLVGLPNGRVAALDLDSGQERWVIAVGDDAPVKSGLFVEGTTLYFGDWNGVVHAYDVGTREERWSFRTFGERPYGSFGAVNSQLTTAGNELFFGARNDTLRVLKKATSEVAWTYVAEDGGWISGDPLILDGTLYIGGSDNHELLAFDATTGTLEWRFTFLNNCFSKPLPYGDALLFTTGDAYNVYGSGAGIGYLYAVRRGDGSLLNFVRLGGNLYTTLVLVGDTLVAASEDGKVYGLNVSRFLSEPPRLREKGYGVLTMEDASPNPFDEAVRIPLEVEGRAEVRVTITGLDEQTVAELYSGVLDAGSHDWTWDGHDSDGDLVDDGYYYVVAEVGDTVLKRFVQKKFD
jgi:outer membrane protein assembly factor BamB